MQKRKPFFLFLSFLIVVSFILCVATCKMPTSEGDFSAFQEAMLNEVNFARTDPTGYADARLKSFTPNDNGAYNELVNYDPVPALKMRDGLCVAASKYAQYMAEHNVFGHEGNGTPSSRCQAAGYMHYSGENIAVGGFSNQNAEVNPKLAAKTFVIQLIIDSGVDNLGHRKNIMNSTHTHFGCGFFRYTASDNKNYIVQDFGRE